MPVTSDIFMWRLNCPASEVLMTEKRSAPMVKLPGSTSSEVPSVLLSQAAICAHSAPTHTSMRLVGNSGLLGPNNTVSIIRCLQKKAITPTMTMAMAPRTKCGRRASMCSKKVISDGSVSSRFMLGFPRPGLYSSSFFGAVSFLEALSFPDLVSSAV